MFMTDRSRPPHEIEQGFEVGGRFAQFHGGGIDGSHKEFTNEFVDFADDVAIFAIPDESPRDLHARRIDEHRRGNDAPGGFNWRGRVVRAEPVGLIRQQSRACKIETLSMMIPDD
jgi:hypothetical protein